MQMRNVWVILGLCLSLFVGCVDDADNVSVYVSGHVSTDEECILNISNPLLLYGVLDISLSRTYVLHPLYNNQLLDRSSTAPLRVDTNGVIIEGAEVRILNANREEIIPTYTVPGTVFIPSSGNDGPGQQIGTLIIIPNQVGDQIATIAGDGATVFAAVKAFGTTNGDVAVETDEWLWPIDLCNGCLAQCRAEGEEDTKNCTYGQDGPTLITCDPT